jgi:hypothetical protein
MICRDCSFWIRLRGVLCLAHARNHLARAKAIGVVR